MGEYRQIAPSRSWMSLDSTWPRLQTADLSEDEQRRRWERVKRGAPGLWEKSGARSIVESVVSAAIRQQLGL